MNISAQAIDLFPTRIWSFDLSELSDHFPLWEQILSDWRATEPVSKERSTRTGWSSEKTIFADPRFAPLLEASKQAYIHAFREVLPQTEIRFRLEAWANIHDQYGYNLPHIHQSVLMSGCFYLTVPPGAGALTFRDPRPGVVLSPFLGKGPNCNQTMRLTPKPGALVIFPNWLEHGVEPNEALTERQSIGINAHQA